MAYLNSIAKILGTAIALAIVWLQPDSKILQAVFIGMLPIWLEVLSTHLTKLEPSRQCSFVFKIFDNTVDAISFLFVPTFWLFTQTGSHYLVGVGTFFFTLCGVFRLIRFVKRGLVGGRFEGLPVTYTGYFWLPAYLLIDHSVNHLVLIYVFLIAIVLLSIAMISKRVKIKPSL